MSRMPILATCCLVLTLVPASEAGGGRSLAHPYVASVIDGCVEADVPSILNDLAQSGDGIGSSLLGDDWMSLPQVREGPVLGHGACFPVLAGETSVEVTVADAHLDAVTYYYGFSDDAGPLLSGSQCSTDETPLPIPPGTTRLSVTVLAANVAPECATAGATTGMILATFT